MRCQTLITMSIVGTCVAVTIGCGMNDAPASRGPAQHAPAGVPFQSLDAEEIHALKREMLGCPLVEVNPDDIQKGSQDWDRIVRETESGRGDLTPVSKHDVLQMLGAAHVVLIGDVHDVDECRSLPARLLPEVVAGKQPNNAMALCLEALPRHFSPPSDGGQQLSDSEACDTTMQALNGYWPWPIRAYRGLLEVAYSLHLQVAGLGPPGPDLAACLEVRGGLPDHLRSPDAIDCPGVVAKSEDEADNANRAFEEAVATEILDLLHDHRRVVAVVGLSHTSPSGEILSRLRAPDRDVVVLVPREPWFCLAVHQRQGRIDPTTWWEVRPGIIHGPVPSGHGMRLMIADVAHFNRFTLDAMLGER